MGSYFWCPRVILSGNGGEFSNDLLCEVCEQFNITMGFTAAETPWSNGSVERHNVTLGKNIKKSKLDNDNTYPIDVVVTWAISAKNALKTCYGFSPNQLVYGKSTNLPSNLVNVPPVIEDVSHADILVKHLNAL